MKLKSKLTATAILLITSSITMSQTNITIYSEQQGNISFEQIQNGYQVPGYAVIREQRKLPMQQGQFQLAFDQVTEHIDPTTVTLSTPDNPGAVTVLEQNFQFDLVNDQKLLQKYLNQPIIINHNQGQQAVETKGKLLSTQGGLIIQQNDGSLKNIKQWNQITFPNLPEGLLVKPTLIWQLNSQLEGPQKTAISYQSKGMTWWADYNISLNQDQNQCQMDLSAWVTIVNKTGTGFKQAQLKLIAGEVNRVTQNNHYARHEKAVVAAPMMDGGIESNPLFEYHIYRLPRAVELPDNSIKQQQLLNVANIDCQKQLIYDNSKNVPNFGRHPITQANAMWQNNQKITAVLSFKNDQANHLGSPMPAGRIRVNTVNPNDGSMEFIGEDRIDHTAKDETIKLTLGKSFDLKAKRRQTAFQQNNHSLSESIAIDLKNHKDSEQTIEVIEPIFRWSNWKIEHSSHQYKQTGPQLITFKVKVPANGKTTIKYKVNYQW